MSRLRGTPSSPLSAYADSIYDEFHDFHMVDGDVVSFVRSSLPMIYRRESGILRVIERKREDEELRRSQREILPGLAELIDLAVRAGVLASGSGVWLARSLQEGGYVIARIMPGPFARRNLAVIFQTEEEQELDAIGFRDFVRGIA